MAGPPQMKHWLNWRDVSGTQSTIEDFRAMISKYPRTSLLLACSELSVHLNFGPEGETNASKELTEKWIPFLFKLTIAARVKVAFDKGRVIFFQAQLRFIAAEVTRLTPAPAETLPPIENEDLGELLLRAAELLVFVHPKPGDPLDALANLAVQFVPVYEINSPSDPFTQLMRIYIMLTVNIPRLTAKGPLKFDVAAEFERASGFSLQIFMNFMFAILMHATIQRDSLHTENQSINPLGPIWLKTTTLSPETIHQVLSTMSFTLASMVHPKKPHGFADFTFLRDTPYFRDQGNYYCLDYEFGLGKLESGVIWRVRDNLEENRREPYLSFWGPVFEDYIAWLFETYASKKDNEYHPSPKLADGKTEICDSIVMCGNTAILLEAKVATCDIETKYSGDYKRMKTYLEKKLVGTPTNRKGITQLLKAIENITTLPKESLPPYLAKANKIIPLIVTKDEIGSGWIINKYLNQRFEEQIDKKKYKAQTITPLVTMSAGTVERAMRALAKMPLSKILEDRITANRDLGQPFEAASKYVHRGTARNMPQHMVLMKQGINDMITDFGVTEADGSPGVVV
jgi:hypothetical protein